MDGLERVTFRFEGEIEVRYLTAAPEPGHLVTHGQEIWVVLGVVEDGVGKLVLCRPPTKDPLGARPPGS